MSWLTFMDVQTRDSGVQGIMVPTGQAHLVDDAADALRRCAHAFADHRTTIGRAQRSLGAWSGEGKLACERSCDSVSHQLDLFRHGSTDAATALREYASVLRHHKLAIKRNVEQARDVGQRMARAQRLAATAKTAASDAARKASEVAVQPHGAPKAQQLCTQAEEHARQGGAHERTADACAGEIEAIERRARRHLEQIGEAAMTATKTLLHVAERLPKLEPQNTDGPGDIILRSTTTTTGGSVTVVIFKLGADHTVVQETQANGETKVTIMNTLAAGLGLAFGGKLNVGKTSGGGSAPGLSVGLMVELMAALTNGRTWKFKTPGEAQRFLDRNAIERLTSGDYGKEAETFSKGGINISATGATGVASADASLGAALAQKVDKVSGEVTTIYEVMHAGSVSLETVTLGASAGTEGTSAVAVTRLKGEIVKLTFSSATSAHASVNLTGAADLRDVARRISEVNGGASDAHERLVQSEIQLNVDKRNRPIVERYLNTLGLDRGAMGDLTRELDHSASVIVTEADSDETGVAAGFKIPFLQAEGHHSKGTEEVESAKIKLPGDDEFHTLRLSGAGTR